MDDLATLFAFINFAGLIVLLIYGHRVRNTINSIISALNSVTIELVKSKFGESGVKVVTGEKDIEKFLKEMEKDNEDK